LKQDPDTWVIATGIWFLKRAMLKSLVHINSVVNKTATVKTKTKTKADYITVQKRQNSK